MYDDVRPELDLVLQRRAAHADRLRSLGAQLRTVRDAVLRSEDALAAVRSTVNSAEAQSAVFASAQSANEAVARIDAQTEAIDALEQRFNRGHLVIGAIGQARQGKSRFLQSLTGLSATHIPDSDAGFCTGVTTLISHGQQFSAEVQFLEREAYFQIIRHYFEDLNLPAPESLDSYWAGGVPPLPADRLSRVGAVHRHLARQWAARSEVQSLLGAPPRCIRAEEIAEYITQADGARDRHKHLAVARLDLTAPYKTGLANVAVLDLPGLGDTNLTDTDRLLSAISDEVDVVVTVRKPVRDGDDWKEADIQLQSHAEKALPEIGMAQRSFLLLNHSRREGNLAQCERMAVAAPTAPIDAAEIRIVDAASPEEVEAFFAMVVAALPTSVGTADNDLVARRREGVSEALKAVERYADVARSVVGVAAPLPEHAKARMVSEARKDLAAGLEGLVSDLRDNLGIPVASVGDRFEELLRAAEGLLARTTPAEFQRRTAREGSKAVAYERLLQETGAALATHFTALDPTLRDSLNEVKEQVAHALLSDGRLDAAIAGRDGPSIGRLIEVLDDPLISLPPGSAVLGALRTLRDAELSYRGFLQHRVQKCLERMNPNHPLYPVSQFAEDGNVSGVPAQRFLDAVEQTGMTALHGGGGIRSLFDDVRVDPGWAAYAVVEEFVDRALRSEGADEEWEAIYRRFQDKVWAEEFSRAAQNDATLRAAQDASQSLRKAVEKVRTNLAPDGTQRGSEEA